MTIGSNDIKIFNSIEKGTSTSVVYQNYASGITVDVPNGYSVEGITVTPYIYNYTDDSNVKHQVWEIVISGSISVEKIVDGAVDNGEATITLSGIATMNDDVVLGNNVLVVFAKYDKDGTPGAEEESELYILGNVSAFKGSESGNNAGIQGSANGVLTVLGKYSTNVEITNMSVINAASYEIAKTATTDKTYVYTTLAQAVTDGATKITVTGQIEVDSDITVPSGTTVTNNGTITIDSEATVSFVTGAVYKGTGTTDVDGTLYFEDRKTGMKAGTVTSEVISEGEKDRTYTSLSKALASAQSGDVIKLSGEADIKVDTTIPAGVTVDTNMKGDVNVFNDVTLTVDGTLYLNGNNIDLADPVTESASSAAKDSGAIVLNGMIKSTSAIDPDLEIPGAYYQLAEKGIPYYYVEPVAVAAPKIATVDYMEMTVNAFETDLALGDVSFTGTADKSATVKVVGKVNGNITLDLASISFNGEAFKGTVTNATGTIALDGDAGSDLVITSSTKDDVKTLKVAGGFTPGSKKKVTVSGDVSFNGFNASPVTVDGNVKITGNSTILALTVNGTVVVDNGKRLTVTDAYVFGTLSAAAATDSKGAGEVKAGDVYLGLASKEVTSGSAAIDGKITVSDLLYILDGTTFPAEMVEGKQSVQFYVEGKLWMTVYEMGSTVTTVNVNQVPVENVTLIGWATEEGKTGVLGPVEIKDNKVYADIKYDVYTVKFVAAEGIDDIYLDGVLVAGSTLMGFNPVSVAAGQHTVSYTLANGYTGEAKMLVDGKEVSGLTFT
ncbi:MAG: hypothetical protein IJV90_04045, partial [Candidatus Methanomethylophilaceae archaeon]|nr:hypothetical protein [Candidatus Methanomethylophilaceae archaeon]